MADQPTVVHIGENSPEEVALKLLRTIANVEGKLLAYSLENIAKVADREWILDTYAECIKAVKGHRYIED